MKNFLMVIFAGITLKLFKVGPPFPSFNPCSSCPSAATDDRKQFRCLNIVLNHKTGPLWFRRVNSIDAKKVLAFYKDSRWRYRAPFNVNEFTAVAKQNSWSFKALELTKCTRLNLTFNGVFFGDTPLSVVQ